MISCPGSEQTAVALAEAIGQPQHLAPPNKDAKGRIRLAPTDDVTPLGVGCVVVEQLLCYAHCRFNASSAKLSRSTDSLMPLDAPLVNLGAREQSTLPASSENMPILLKRWCRADNDQRSGIESPKIDVLGTRSRSKTGP